MSSDYLYPIITIFLSYALGSISGSMVMGKLFSTDIREKGSGNAGATNALRVMGFKFAFGVFLIDILKGFVSAQYISSLFTLASSNEIILCGAAAVLGHVYPVFYNFRGGKGAATLVGALLVLYPQSIPVALLVWIATIVLSGYVGLATMLAGCSLPVMVFINQKEGFILYILLSLLIIFTHRSNIIRMINKNENRFEKAMIFKKKN